MHRRFPVWWVPLVATALAAASCGAGESGVAPFTISISPEFVQGIVPGEPTGILVTITDAERTDQPAHLTVTMEGAEATVDPADIRQGEVAEVTLVAGPTAVERGVDIVVTGTRGDLEVTATRSTIIRPWESSEEEHARSLLGLFTSWLAVNQPQLGIGPSTEFSGSFVSPVLVVTHYLFLSDEWEVGLSWHVMLPPDDWSEIYLRPRDELSPILAFRLRSQAGALRDGIVDIEAVEPPAEVTR